eukprot:403344908
MQDKSSNLSKVNPEQQPPERRLSLDQAVSNVSNIKTVYFDNDDQDHSNLNFNSQQQIQSQQDHQDFEEILKQKSQELRKKSETSNSLRNQSNQSAKSSKKSLLDGKMRSDDQPSQDDKNQISSKNGTVKPTNTKDRDGPQNSTEEQHLESQHSNSLQNLLDKNESDQLLTKNLSSKDSQNFTRRKTIKLQLEEMQIQLNKVDKDLDKDDKSLLEGDSYRENNSHYQQDTDLLLQKKSPDNDLTAIKSEIQSQMSDRQKDVNDPNISPKVVDKINSENQNETVGGEDILALNDLNDKKEILSGTTVINSQNTELSKDAAQKVILKEEDVNKQEEVKKEEVLSDEESEFVNPNEPLRYRDRDFKNKPLAELLQVYSQHEEKLSRSQFIEEMQSAKTYFSDDGFKKFQCNSRIVERKQKGFYYVYDNKLFVLRQKRKLQSQKTKPFDINQVNEGVQMSQAKGGDDNPYDAKDTLKSMFLEMINQGKTESLKFQEKQSAKKYYSFMNNDQIGMCIDDKTKQSNFIISIYQMPELSHISDVDTGLLRVSINTKLIVKNINQFILHDKYCLITLRTAESPLKVPDQFNAYRAVFLIDDTNNEHDKKADKILGIVTKKKMFILIFMRNCHVKFKLYNISQSNTEYRLNELHVENEIEPDSVKQFLTFDKVICCEGNVGIGLKKYVESDQKLGHFVLINGEGKLIQKKPCQQFYYSKIRQRTREFYQMTGSNINKTIQIKLYNVCNQEIIENSFQFSLNEKQSSEKTIVFIMMGCAFQNEEEDEQYCTDQSYQIVIPKRDRNRMKLTVIDMINSNMQTYSFNFTGTMPQQGLINNKNYILNTERGKNLENIYLGDLKYCEFQTLSAFDIDAKHLNPWTSSMRQISLYKLGLVINEDFKWNWELFSDGFVSFTKSKINSGNIDTYQEIQTEKFKIVSDQQIDLATISPDLMHIFIIKSDNFGCIQRMNIGEDQTFKHQEYSFQFSNPFDVVSFSNNELILIGFSRDVLVFMKHSFEFKGCYQFNDKIRKFKVIDKQLYIDQDSYKGEICIQGEEDFFTYLNRFNPEKLNTKVTKALQKLTFLNPDNEVIGYLPFRNWSKILLHRLMLNMDLQDNEIQSYINSLDEVQLSLEIGLNNYDIDGSLSHMLVTRSYRNAQFLQKRLIQINKKNTPKLFRQNSQLLTPFDIAMKKGDFQSIIILMDIMIRYQNHTEFNYLIDPHINFLIEKKANLEEYFNSNLPISKIKNISYLDYSNDGSTIIYADFDQAQSVNYIMNNYDEIFKNIKLCNDGSAVQIEYLLINMPKTIESLQFIQNLSQINDLDIFESECIQIILDYKWDTYTNKFYLTQFTIFILFLISYIIDLYYFVIWGSERDFIQQIIVKLVCVCALFASGYYEYILIRKQTLSVYIQEGWNFFDIWMIIHYFAIIVIDIINEVPEAIVILQGVMLVLIFLKLCQNLRIFQGFSFQVTMLQAVFYDIKYFILLYVFVIFMYGLIFTLLRIKTSEEDDDYEGISLFGYFIMAFRASTGDFQIDQFKQLQEEHIIYAWIMWISAVLFLNIILLNFIIAVISESYEKVMQKMKAESYRIKCQLIKERELFFNENALQDLKIFPRYIILRRPVQEKEDANAEWQGFVKDIKKNLLKSTQTLALDNDTKHQSVLQKLDLVMKSHGQIKEEMAQQQQTFGRIIENLKNHIKEDKENMMKDMMKEMMKEVMKDMMKEINAKFDKLDVLLPKEEIKEVKIEEEVDKKEEEKKDEPIEKQS